jgi:hypothetical protein
MNVLQWIRAFLIVVPLGVAGFMVHWVTLVTEPVLLAACGPGMLTVGVLTLVAALASSVFAFLAFKQIPPLVYKSFLFHGFFISTTLGIVLAFVGLVATSTESQMVCSSQIGEYVAAYNTSDSKATGYLKRYNSEYKRLVFQFAFGQTSHEAFFMLNTAWLGLAIAFFAVAELP